MSFNNIIEQPTAIKTILNMIEKDEAAGSYLFLGPDGTGKRTFAMEFAKVLNCEDVSKDGSCDECVSCKKIIKGNHPDVFDIIPEGPSRSIKIDKARDIIYQASLKPYEAKKRFFIINNAESLTIEAQNALLKILEEPPLNHILILTASNVMGILPTVVSRCKVIKFNLIKKNRIREFLVERGFEEKEAVLFSHMSLGSLGKAVLFKDKDLISKRDQVLNDFFFKKSAILKEASLKAMDKEGVEEALYILLSWYRDLLVAKFTKDKEGLLNIDRSEEIISYADRFKKEALEKNISNIVDTITFIRKNVNPKIALFNMAIELKRG
ncbi:MAG: DNA polymerase III subunit delta' [Candidatus Omnitrophota bacterium]